MLRVALRGAAPTLSALHRLGAPRLVTSHSAGCRTLFTAAPAWQQLLKTRPSNPSETWRSSQRVHRAAGRGLRVMASVSSGGPYVKVSPKEAFDVLESGTYRYLDVRTAEEFGAGHVPQAVNVPIQFKGEGGKMEPNPDFVKQVEGAIKDKGAALVVGCKMGKRAEAACNQLSEAGWNNLACMPASYDGWVKDGLPVEQ